MAQKKVPLVDVKLTVGKSMVVRFMELVDASTLTQAKNPNFNKNRLILKCCLRFMYAVTKSWHSANQYAESMSADEAELVISALMTGVPPHAHATNNPVIPFLRLRSIEADDPPVEYTVQLAMRDLACICNVAKFLGVEIALADFDDPDEVMEKRISAVVNTIVWYSHVILMDKGKKQIRRMQYKVRTGETPTSEEMLPFHYPWSDFMDPFLKDFCRKEFFA